MFWKQSKTYGSKQYDIEGGYCKRGQRGRKIKEKNHLQKVDPSSGWYRPLVNKDNLIV